MATNSYGFLRWIDDNRFGGNTFCFIFVLVVFIHGNLGLTASVNSGAVLFLQDATNLQRFTGDLKHYFFNGTLIPSGNDRSTNAM